MKTPTGLTKKDFLKHEKNTNVYLVPSIRS